MKYKISYKNCDVTHVKQTKRKLNTKISNIEIKLIGNQLTQQ